MFLVFRRLHILLVALTCVTAKVTIEDKAFKNVLVSFSQTVLPDDGKSLVLEMQNIMIEASQVLQNAVGLKVGSVSFIIPSSWDTSTWENMTVEDASTKHVVSPADIIIDGIADSAFGQNPFTVQYAGCGVPGDKIRIPKDFLTQESKFHKGNLLAREWLKYRYGVFDENGFLGDAMYPLYETLYGRQGEYHVTSCTDTEVEYFFRKEDGSNCTLNEETGLPQDNECRVYPTEESAQNVTSSLMFLHENLQDIEHICGDGGHKHDDTSSNKQNILCRGKSIWDILRSSSDFAIQNNEEEPSIEEEHEIKFNYVRERSPRVVVTWDSSSRNKDKKEIIFNAIRRFVYDLPDGSEYALISYQDKVTVRKPLTKLNAWPEGRDVAVVSDFTNPLEACSSCAIEKGLEVLSAPDDESPEMGGSIVIIASTDPEENENIINKLRASQVCLHVIAFVDSGASVVGFQRYLEASACGKIWEVPNSEEKADVFARIYEGMENLLPSKVKDTVTSTVQTGYLSYDPEMTIPVDSNTEAVVIWLADFSDSQNIICKQGNTVLTLNTLVGSSNLAAVQFKPISKSSEAKCRFRHEGSDPILTQVRSITKPGAYYEINTWTVDTTESVAANESKQQMPVIIYVSLQYGSYPVKDAEVKAVVRAPDGTEVASLLLTDDGRGDPDVTANDGVYSRYFTKFTEEGEYTVSITAKDNGQAAWGWDGKERCCGSKVNSKSSALGTFEKVSQLTFNAVSGRPEQGYKPSRISDLRIEKFDSESIELKWTAPGGEADSGAATNYLVELFTVHDEAIAYSDENTEKRIYNLTVVPKEYGNIETAEIEIDDDFKENTKYFIALRTENIHGQMSDASNIKEIYVSEKRPTEEPEATTTVDDDDIKSRRAAERKRMVGIIIGVIVAVIVIGIIAYAAVHYFVIKPKERAEKESRNSNNLKMEANPTEKNIHPLTSIPADVIMKHHIEVVNAKNQHKSPPVFKEEDIEAQRSAVNNNDGAEVEAKDDESSQPAPPKSPKRMTFV
ncbi:calcium-activated chloride channel regulator 1-like isoform X2 [Uloborus diversus]|uniref:calcium-activated chloride channel regulator 1-like isoform X2 n=1 Tax=Uloborus diversus TaxID=327109 RepID=UPI0024090543|nr:calcium-activated chloride channel regulator 1-like isoform X2 [Uloborus diversus]